MKRMKRSLWLLSVLLLPLAGAPAQAPDAFDLEAYRGFLASHRDLTAQQLLSLHPAGTFAAQAATPVTGTPYLARIDSLYHFTPYELELLGRHGFVVSERLQKQSMGIAYMEAYHADLPVVVTTDAILHAFHMSYDALLQTLERRILIGALDSLLTRLHDGIPALAAQYGATPGMRGPLRDADFYIAVGRQLLGNTGTPMFPENAARVTAMLGYIAAEKPEEVPLFGGYPRAIDFSQFTPRGHYTEEPRFQRYFKAMMWLGRTEIFFAAPKEAATPVPDSIVQQQAITALLLVEAAQATSGDVHYERIERILRFFVGDQDNITLSQLARFLAAQGITGASALLPATAWEAFRHELLQQSYASQRIISQLLWSDPFDTEQIVPASAFLLVGQRFIVDSYVTGNVVYDRILYENRKIRRMLPSSLDVLFALGNDAAGQLLESELAAYPYASNLAGLRYLIDNYEPSYWQSTIYNGWLQALRALNPPPDRTTLPAFMQTAAWWQQKMNTQLSGWAQLRHDNLLYAKQSYSGMVVCSFPESYVEPIPAFFDAMKAIAQSCSAQFAGADYDYVSDVRGYFTSMESIMDTLGGIARKELSSTPLTDDERRFLRSMLYEGMVGCASGTLGWYARLYFTGDEGLETADFIVADVHTAPTDEFGGMVGWVLHAGTGAVTMGTFIVTLPGGERVACVGPMLSYHEYVSTNFKRLTDEEWKTQHAVGPAFRPDFVNLYLADAVGGSRGAGRALQTAEVSVAPRGDEVPGTIALLQNHPNPFNSTTIIPLSIGGQNGCQHVQLRVFDVSGQLVRTLLDADLPAGHYAVRWEGVNDMGNGVASGTYFYTLRTDTRMETKKLVVLR